MRSANREAVTCFTQALDALSHLPEQRGRVEQAIDLRFDLRNALVRLRDYGQMLVFLREAETLAQALDDRRRLGQVTAFIAHYGTLVGDYHQTVVSAQRTLASTEALGDFTLQVQPNFYLGQAYHGLGDYRRAINYLRRNVASLEGERVRERFGGAGLPSVSSRATLARCLTELGECAEAITLGEEAVRCGVCLFKMKIAADGGAIITLTRISPGPSAVRCVVMREEENIMGRLDGKVALISGGARGQGACEAKMFCREGAKVVFGDVLDTAGQATEAEVRAVGGEATYIHLNVTSEADWRAAVATAERLYGHLNILVNNAGILIRKSIEETTEDDWDRIMAVNVKGVFLGTKHAIPAMRRAGGGSIVNISSTAGLVGSPGDTSAYTATKGAVRLFTKATATQHARDKIRCNSVHPGPIATDMIKDTLENPDLWEKRLQRLPMRRVGAPEDVAYGVLYLASDESSFVTGSELVIDGGTTAE